jgi:hypothetical protein
MTGTVPVPLPIPDPTTIPNRPAAAVRLRTQAARAPTGADITALADQVSSLAGKFDAHVADDAQWKHGVEGRLPAA